MAKDDFKFNLQTYLKDMREEQRTDHRELAERIDKALGDIHNHDARLVVVENTRKQTLWLAGTVIVAIVGALIDLAMSHLPKLVK